MKTILDVTCGSKSMWFDKNNENTIYTDLRNETINIHGKTIQIRPDKIEDFRSLSFKDNSFKLVIFDPPHAKHLGKNSVLKARYTTLWPTWQEDIRIGLNECIRVLEKDGILIFKWSEIEITTNRILKIIDHKPLFGHTSNKGKKIWLIFIKK